MKKVLFIPSAGVGSRLKELTLDRPKALVEYKGRPLIKWVIDKALDQEFEHVVVNVHHYADMIEDYLKTVDSESQIMISDERELLMDTGGALTHSIKYLDNFDYVLVHNVDVLSNLDLKQLCLDFENSQASAFLVLQQRPTDRRLAVNPENNRIWAWYNSKTGEIKSRYSDTSNFDPENTYAYNGIHILRVSLIKEWVKQYGSSPFSVIDSYLESALNHRIEAYIPKEPFIWRDMGKLESFETDFII